MKNSIAISTTHSERTPQRNIITNIYLNLLAEFKRGQTGYSTIAIIGQSCIGSVAAMMILMSNLTKTSMLVILFLVTILCMAYNGAVLAQLKSRITFNILLVSVVFSCIVIVAGLI